MKYKVRLDLNEHFTLVWKSLMLSTFDLVASVHVM